MAKCIFACKMAECEHFECKIHLLVESGQAAFCECKMHLLVESGRLAICTSHVKNIGQKWPSAFRAGRFVKSITAVAGRAPAVTRGGWKCS